MPILVTCTGCGAQLNAPDNAVGKAIKCPKCQAVVNVPAAGGAPAATAGAQAPGADMGGGPVAGPSGGGSNIPANAPNKVACGVLAILLGGLGIHKFMLGMTKPAVIMLVVWIVGLFCTVGIASFAMGVIGLVEGIIYLTKTDEEFYQTYVVNKKEWF